MTDLLGEARKISEMEILQAKAAAGDDIAKLKLGYYHAIGINPNYGETIKIFEELSQKNIPEAQYNLGIMYLYGCGIERNENKAIKMFEKADENGLDYAKIFLYI